jgi:hypothetical protein
VCSLKYPKNITPVPKYFRFLQKKYKPEREMTDEEYFQKKKEDE